MKKTISNILIISMLSANIANMGYISYADKIPEIENDIVSYQQENMYETFKRPIPKTISTKNLTPHEVKDTQGLSQIKYFKTKTDSNYEVALSHGNGNYTYVESTDTLDKAINIANKNKDLQKSNNIPVVISKEGVIVYATEAIAKIVKMKDGQTISQNGHTAMLYKDKEGTKEHGVIAHGYIDDVPVIEATDAMVKIEAAGFNGWIKRNDSKGENLIMLPINDAPNLSYYQINSKNQFVHIISTAVEAQEGSANSRVAIADLGVAPSFMQQYTKYYSYDGTYFYTDINTLISDVRAGHHNNAVNASSPYYNYYTSVPARSKTVYTAAELDKYINENSNQNSVLRGTGESFIKYQDIYGVNALMALGIAINESAFGMSMINNNNIFGLNAVDGNESGATGFESVDACIKEFMNNYISRYYCSVKWSKYNGSNLGNKNIGINVRYASDPFWSEKAGANMHKIDKAISGGSLKEHNSSQIGIYTKEDQVLSKDGYLVHKVLNEREYNNTTVENTAQVGDMVLISGEVEDKYEISPDRAKTLRVGTYDSSFKGYINKSSVKLINQKESSNTVKINELAGDSRYTTAIKVSQRGWNNSDNVVIVNSGAIVDALSATPFAHSKNAPILLTQKEGLNEDTKKEISRLKAKNVYIIGGSGVVSEKVLSDLKAMNLYVERISGDDRYKTSLAVANKLSNVSQIAVVNGETGLPDAVSIAPVAATKNMPIILSSPNNGVLIFKDYIKNNNINKTYIVGGTGAISENIANSLPNTTRLGGDNRNHTNAKIVEHFYTNRQLNNIFVGKDGMKNKDQLIDALAVGVLAAKEQSPIIIVGNTLETNQKNILSKKTTKELTKVGAGGNENAFNELKNMYR